MIDELLEVTDRVMLDLKQMNDEIHQNLVGVSNHRTLEFARYLSNKDIKVWIRYVVVLAGLTMTTPHTALANLPAIWATLKNRAAALPRAGQTQMGGNGRRVQTGWRQTAEERDHGAREGYSRAIWT